MEFLSPARNFSGYFSKKYNFCLKYVCLPYPKIFRPVTRNTLIFYLALSFCLSSLNVLEAFTLFILLDYPIHIDTIGME